MLTARTALRLGAASLAAAALLSPTAQAATNKPKYGVFGTPANSRCLSGSPTFTTACKGQVRIYDYTEPATQKVRKGDRRVAFSAFKTGCKALDRFSPAGFDLKLKSGAFSASQTSNYFIEGASVKLTFRVNGTFTSATRVAVTLRVSASPGERRKTKCAAAAFEAKNSTVRWFAAKNTGG